MVFGGLAAILSGGGCITPQQVVVTDVDPMHWERPTRLTLPITDTLARHQIEFFIRHNDRFADDTLSVDVTTYSSGTLRHSERIVLRLPRTTSAAALTHQTTIPYRHRVRFPHTGNYQIIITPTRPVAGIESFGVNLEKSN